MVMMPETNYVEIDLCFFPSESVEYGAGFTFSLYGEPENVKKFYSQLDSDSLLPLDNHAFRGKRELILIKDSVLLFAISLVLLYRLIELLKQDSNQKYSIRKQAPWGSSDIILEGSMRCAFDIAIAGDRKYSFGLGSKYIDMPKELTIEKFVEFLEELYASVRSELK
jgi:hypothetical protein